MSHESTSGFLGTLGCALLFLALIIIGALNWGLIGFFRYDLVAAIFGGQVWDCGT